MEILLTYIGWWQSAHIQTSSAHSTTIDKRCSAYHCMCAWQVLFLYHACSQCIHALNQLRTWARFLFRLGWNIFYGDYNNVLTNKLIQFIVIAWHIQTSLSLHTCALIMYGMLRFVEIFQMWRWYGWMEEHGQQSCYTNKKQWMLGQLECHCTVI